MQIAPYWAKGAYVDEKNEPFAAYGYSFQSQAEAQQDAQARAEWLYKRIHAGQPPETYEYSKRPIREEIIETIETSTSSTAVITRNRYGALVLNAADCLFADIDFPPIKPVGFIDYIKMAFPIFRDSRRHAIRQETIARVNQWLERSNYRQFRLYRTFAGLRLILTDKTYDPASRETERILNELGSDSLYKRLTVNQQCFRARLTPKPWRCDCKRPPVTYPYGNAEAEQAQRAWEAEYERVIAKFATCRLLRESGTPEDESISRIIALHDQHALRTDKTTLA